MKYGKKLKIERAKALLKHSDSITEIGEKLGFYDQAHFSRTFKSFTGQSPKEYRLKIKMFEWWFWGIYRMLCIYYTML